MIDPLYSLSGFAVGLLVGMWTRNVCIQPLYIRSRQYVVVR